MKNEEVFQIWAPDGSRWSRWAKPVLFSQLAPDNIAPPEFDLVAPNVSWLTLLTAKTAIIVDLPGAASVMMGMALAGANYRPVPLYNSCRGEILLSLVNVQPVMDALYLNTEKLQKLALADDALPAFLLDANRMKGEPQPGRFDNRSMTFPQDFPSANLLLADGIIQVLLLQTVYGQPQEDLAHVLLRWQEAGIKIIAAEIGTNVQLSALLVQRPPLYRQIWQRFLALLELRRNSAGGFGAIVPKPGESSGRG